MPNEQTLPLAMYLKSSFNPEDDAAPQRTRAARHPLDLGLMQDISDYVHDNPGATGPQIAGARQLSRDKTLRHLDELVLRELVFWVRGQGNAQHYYERAFYSGGHAAGHWKLTSMILRHFPRSKAVFELIVKQTPKRLSDLLFLTRRAGINRHVARSAVMLLEAWGIVRLERALREQEDPTIVTDPRIYCEECDYFDYPGGYAGFGRFQLAYFDWIYQKIPVAPHLTPLRRETRQPAFQRQNRRVLPADHRAFVHAMCGGEPEMAIYEYDAIRQFGPPRLEYGNLGGGRWARNRDSKSPMLHYWARLRLQRTGNGLNRAGPATRVCTLRVRGAEGGEPSSARRPKRASICVDCLVIVMAARWDAGNREWVVEWLDGFPNRSVSNAVRRELLNYGMVT